MILFLGILLVFSFGQILEKSNSNEKYGDKSYSIERKDLEIEKQIQYFQELPEMVNMAQEVIGHEAVKKIEVWENFLIITYTDKASSIPLSKWGLDIKGREKTYIANQGLFRILSGLYGDKFRLCDSGNYCEISFWKS